ncbi:DNA polymerase III subunit alpha [bacterium]|nr:DNA polymerase III subunit alpha [bacterium]
MTLFDYTHLHVHSYYSLLDGASSPGELIEKAKNLGYNTLALTDHNALHGSLLFYEACLDAGIKPILGAELTLEQKYHLTVLCKNQEGYKNLSALISIGQLNGGSPDKFDLSFEDLAAHSEGLVVLSGCRKGEIPTKLAEGKNEEAAQIARKFQEMFKDDFYLELIYEKGLDNRRVYHKLINLSRQLGIPVVATNNVHFAEPGDWICHKILASIRLNTTLEDGDDEKFASPEFYLKPPEEVYRDFDEIPEALYNTREIAEKCSLDLHISSLKFPEYQNGSGEPSHAMLKRLTMEGLSKRYGEVTGDIAQRAEYELSIIQKLGFTDYFLVVWDIVKFAKSSNIPVVARGSAANSIVTYALGISNVDPIEQNLFFERFLNLSRSDPPDIDIDLCWRGRDEVLKYVYDKYGHDRVAMISTFSTMKHRSCFREVAKVFGISQGKVNFFSRRIPYFSKGTLKEVITSHAECDVIPYEQEPFRTIIEMADRISSFPRHLGIHCGGIVISPETITNYVPLQMAAKGIAITQYDMFSIEKIGLVKIDLLGQRALTILRETVDAVEAQHGIEIDLDRVTRDRETEHLISKGLTLGCFQIESPGMRSLLQMLKGKTVNDLTIALSLIRPGPAQSGMKKEYVQFRRGFKEIKYLHPILKKVLGDTYGIMLYQEDIIRVTSALAGFTLEEGDFLRRAMTKRRHKEKIRELKQKFFRGTRQKGISTEVAVTIWKRIVGFMSYSFCKSHAATYARIAYQAAYLKAHFPVEYMAAVLTNHAGFYATDVYLQEAKRLGIEILLPNINRSRKNFSAEDGKIRIGLDRVRNLNHSTIEDILEEREISPFASLSDFLQRVKIGKGEVENLIRAGAFDFMDESRSSLLWKLEIIYDDFARWWRSNSLPLRTLQLPRTKSVEYANELPRNQRIVMEYETMELFPSGHPIDLLRNNNGKLKLLTSDEINDNMGKTVNILGYLIAARTITTKNGTKMKFLTFQDKEGTFEVVLNDLSYKLFAKRTLFKDVFLVRGRVKNQYGALNIAATDLRNLNVFADMDL